MDFLKNQSLPAQIGLAATALIGSCTAAYFLYSNVVSSKSTLAPAIDEEEAKKIMNAILKKLKVLVPKLLMAAQNIKMQVQQTGQDIEEMALMRQFLLPHFDSNLKEIQDSVLEEFDVDEDELEEAVNTYIAAGDEELAAISKSIRVMHTQFGGDSDIEEESPKKSEAAEKMGLNEVLTLMKELGNQMMQYTDDFCGEFIDQYGVPASQPHMEQFQLGLMEASQKAEKALLEECGLTESDLQSLLMAHQENPQVQRIFMDMQMDNRKILAKHGIAMQ